MSDAAPAVPAGWGPRGTAGVSFAAALTFDAVDVTPRRQRPVLDDFSLALSPARSSASSANPARASRPSSAPPPASSASTRGRILINDEVVSGPGIHVPPDRRGIGLMFQDFALFPHMTLLANVTFGLQPLGRAAALAQARAGAEARRPRRPRRPTTRTCCPAASSSAWRSPAPSRRAPAS